MSEVVGGVIAFNGRNIIAPVPGMSEDDFEDLIEGLSQDDLIIHGNGFPEFADGNSFQVEMFESSLFGSEAQLITSGFGRYFVLYPGLGFVLTETGEPFELNLGAAAGG